jgi:hypothetical protein
MSCSLQTHIIAHAGDKLYKYDMCGKGFSMSSSLQIHIRTHTGDSIINVSLQRRQICYQWTPAYWSLVPRSSMFYFFEFCLKNMWNCSLIQQILSHRFYDKALWMVCFKLVFDASYGRVVYRVKKSKVLMEDTWEKDLDLRLSKRSWEVFKIHMWFMPLRK